MKDLGEAKTCMKLKICRERLRGTYKIAQRKYAAAVLARFNISISNPRATLMECRHIQRKVDNTTASNNALSNAPYCQATGCPMHLMVGTRPDSAFAIGRLSQQCANPSASHCVAVKQVLRY